MRTNVHAAAAVAAVRRNAGLLYAAAASVVTLFGLFQPWISFGSTTNIDYADCNALGHVRARSTVITLWSPEGLPSLHISSGVWGVLAGVACLLTVVAVVIRIRLRNAFGSRLAIGASLAVAVCVVLTMIQLHSKSLDLMGTVRVGNASNIGIQAGLVFQALTGHGALPVPGLRHIRFTTTNFTSWPMISVVLSLTSVLAVSTRWLRGGEPTPISGASGAQDNPTPER